MTVAQEDYQTMSGRDPYSIPLEDIDVSQADLFGSGEQLGFFKRLRAEAPVHYCRASFFGPYWSITKFKDIMEVDKSHKIFSSKNNISIGDHPSDFVPTNFIASDEPDHMRQRKAVQEGVSPRRLQDVEQLVRERTIEVLDSLPRNEEFNWVELVSKELTSRMLATLFDFPMEERHKLPFWSDVAASSKGRFGPQSNPMPEEERREIMRTYRERFRELWFERAKAEPRFDFISLMAHNEGTKDLVHDDQNFLGNLNLLIIGGNDTTRNSMTGSLYALNKYPDQYEKLKADPSLIPNLVNETIRWQTPLAHMRRNAVEDVEIGGQKIRKGDKVVMWYVSGNRDEDVFENADDFQIDRPNARNHISFGFGIHRCMGNKVAELQLRILWEEIMKRFDRIEVVGEPVRLKHPAIMGYSELPVRINA